MTRRSASPNIAARSAAILGVLAITKSVTSAYNAGAQREAELRAGLRIGGDAARVIVGGARNEPRPQLLHPRIIRNALEQFDHRHAPKWTQIPRGEKAVEIEGSKWARTESFEPFAPPACGGTALRGDLKRYRRQCAGAADAALTPHGQLLTKDDLYDT